MKKRCFLAVTMLCMVLMSQAQNVVADEGAWCWFADPRAVHYENVLGTINATYIGYIDVHGNVKATQYDWVKQRKTDVLIRSYFQPDDHNNPTFIVLPDERVMIFYTRHTDEPKIWYRISKKPGDITQLGDEKYLATANNTTYPSPFILSDDPQHIYLCWRGINWHPTIARLTMPDANDNCNFDFGPKQIVQSTGARPYAKYQSNGRDKIYVSYTTGHPDNEMPDWLYFNVIDINKGNGPILRDLNGTQLSIINNGVFNVSKTDSYASSYPATIVDKSANIRNWVWQIALDNEEHPVVAYPHIDDAKTSHVYWYARWNGSSWKNTWVQYGGHAFHQNWNSTEKCYSGGMAIDPENINDLYLSIPTKNGAYNKDGVYEIWKYTINDAGEVAGSTQITSNSPKNNARPYVIPGTKNSPLRLVWMQGDYYYWIVRQGYPLGYPTAIHSNYAWPEEVSDISSSVVNCTCLKANQTLNVALAMNSSKYEGDILRSDDGNFVYSLNGNTQYPELTVNGTIYKSQNRLLTSDDWATKSTGTSGDNHPTKVTTWVLTMTYDGNTLTVYRNGLVDQVIDVQNLNVDNILLSGSDFNHKCISVQAYGASATPLEVQQIVAKAQENIAEELEETALAALSLPEEVCTDIVLPQNSLGQAVTWSSSDEDVLSSAGVLSPQTKNTSVVLTATVGSKSRQFDIQVQARDITKNLRYEQTEVLDLTSNTATGFNTNKFGLAPSGLLDGLRSFTFLVTVKASSLSAMPRIYDFGSGSGNSVFLRANPLSAGIKYNGGATTMVNATQQLSVNTEAKLAVTFDAATHTTRIYINGEENVSGTTNVNEAYMLYEVAKDTRNYIGRTQWWDTNVANDNQDFRGIISDMRLYDVMLTRKEICDIQDIDYEEKELPTALANGDFEDSYTIMAGTGVKSDRAIYLPKGWTIDYSNGNENDITALKSGDLYFSNFFASRPVSVAGSKQTYWVRQNWGASTITLKQEMRLPAGEYTLKADVWKSGLGGDVDIKVQTEGGKTVTVPSLENKEAWQHVSAKFESDGTASTTILISAIHTSNGSEKIIGFDNVELVSTPTAIKNVSYRQGTPSSEIYDLQGRRVKAPKQGLYIVDGKKKTF